MNSGRSCLRPGGGRHKSLECPSTSMSLITFSWYLERRKKKLGSDLGIDPPALRSAKEARIRISAAHLLQRSPGGGVLQLPSLLGPLDLNSHPGQTVPYLKAYDGTQSLVPKLYFQVDLKTTVPKPYPAARRPTPPELGPALKLNSCASWSVMNRSSRTMYLPTGPDRLGVLQCLGSM